MFEGLTKKLGQKKTKKNKNISPSVSDRALGEEDKALGEEVAFPEC
jgi:hypothetical protein